MKTGFVRSVALVVPLVLVNTVALYGQGAWAYEHIAGSVFVAVVFAGALESVGIYLAVEAHAALMSGDVSGPLRAGSYAVGALAGALNYAHAAGPDLSPTPKALAFGTLSALSPWLWSIRSRSLHRAELREAGLIDPRTVKLPAVAWVLDTRGTFGMFRAAALAGIQRPADARSYVAERRSLAGMSGPDALRYAVRAGCTDLHSAETWLAVRGVTIGQADIDAVAEPVATAPDAVPVPAVQPAPPVPPVPPVAVADDRADHVARLATIGSKRDAIRYAYSATGTDHPTEVIRWLADRGVSVSRSEAHIIGRELAALPVPVSIRPANAR